MHAELQDYLRQLDAVKADAQALIARIPDAQWNAPPALGRWSPAECVDHLTVSVRAALPAVDRAIERARSSDWTASGPFRYGWFARWMVRSLDAPAQRRFKTFPVFQPTPGKPKRQVLDEFLRSSEELAERVRRSDGLDLKRAKVTSPASRFFRLSLGAYLAMLVAHDRRHLWQARQVLQGSRRTDG
ncbi:MAG: DinB family protein [Gemmatimonadales bacterium]